MKTEFEVMAFKIWRAKKHTLILTFIFCAGVLLRILIYNNFIKFPDQATYFCIELAKNLISKGTYSFKYDIFDLSSLKQPLYSLSILCFHWFISNWQKAAFLANSVLQGLTLFPLFFLASTFFNYYIGYAASIIFLFNIYFLIPQQSYGIFTFFLYTTFSLCVIKKRSFFTSFVFTILLSLLWLTRFESILFIPFFLFVYLIEFKSVAEKLRESLFIIGSFLCIIFFINYLLNPQVSLIERLKYRIIGNHIVVLRNFQSLDRKGEKTEIIKEMDSLLSIPREDGLKQSLAKDISLLPGIFKKNILFSIKEMIRNTSSFFLLPFAFLGCFFIKRRFLFFVFSFLPFLYAPLAGTSKNASYTLSSSIAIMILTAAGLLYFTVFIYKIFLKRHGYIYFTPQVVYFILVLCLSVSLFLQKLPLIIEPIPRFKLILSEKYFKGFVMKNIPSGSKILCSEKISPFLLFNDYRLFIAIKSDISGIISYAKNKDIEYSLLDKDIIDGEYEDSIFSGYLTNHVIRWFKKYEKSGLVFYLVFFY